MGREHGDGGRIIQASNPANFAPLNGRAIPERDSDRRKASAPVKLTRANSTLPRAWTGRGCLAQSAGPRDLSSQPSPANVGDLAGPFTVHIECEQTGSRSAVPSRRPLPTQKPSTPAAPSSVASPAPTTSTGESPVRLLSEIAGRRMDRRKANQHPASKRAHGAGVGRPLSLGPKVSTIDVYAALEKNCQ